MKKFIIVIAVICLLCTSLFVLASCSIKSSLINNDSNVDLHPLTNPNATAETKALYNYLCEQYKHKIISGQQESDWMEDRDYEFNYIYNKTGKYPAMRGLDFINDNFTDVVARAKEWHNKGGIVTICWHCSNQWDKGYTESQNTIFTAEEWEKVLTSGTPENTAFLQGMDKAAPALKELEEAGIPVLWRPFHEFDGGWFWWGKNIDGEGFVKLWKLMYNHYTNDLHLNNLIWVLGYSQLSSITHPETYYPGDAYVDITGADSYYTDYDDAEARLYDPLYEIVGDRKPLILHETSFIPSVEAFQEVPWGSFLTWHTEWLINDDNTDEHLYDIYNSDYVITLDEVPNIYAGL